MANMGYENTTLYNLHYSDLTWHLVIQALSNSNNALAYTKHLEGGISTYLSELTA